MSTKKNITISINPTYLCNFRCSFCYLSKNQLSDSSQISIDKLFNKLSDIAAEYSISHIDLYGGEVGILSDDYLNLLIKTIKIFYTKKINIITNFYKINHRFLEDDIDLTISWDDVAREKSEIVFSNMKNLKKPFHILTLASDIILQFTNEDISKYVSKLNSLEYLETLEIKPYSLNSHHIQNCNFTHYENFIIKLLNIEKKFKFKFENKSKINDSLNKKYSAWSDDHIYLQPNGEFAVLEFDENLKEYFMEVESISEYKKWTYLEKEKIASNTFCSQCRFFGSCLSEHLQNVKSLDNSCNGFYNLLDWYEKTIFQK